MKRLLITGARDWTDFETMNEALREVAKDFGIADTVLIHGAAKGADTMAGEIWTSHGGIVEVHPADWTKHGRAAGPIRNLEMVKSGADLCLAFITPSARGTWHCVNEAKKAGIKVKEYWNCQELPF